MKEFLNKNFELTRISNDDNVRPMEGMRGFAVFLVFLVHYVTLINPWISAPALVSIKSAMHTIGNSGVDLFFVLSGFLIYGSLISRPQKFLPFMSRRVVRIYPTFIVVFIIYLALSFIFRAENKIPSSFPDNLIYLTQNFLLLPGLFPIEPMITVAWSLSYEMFYYIAIPFVVVLFQLRQRSATWRISFFLCLSIATVICCAVYGGPIRLIMFMSGILLYEAIESRFKFRHNDLMGFLALIVGLLSTLLPMSGHIGYALKISILYVSFLALCIACFQTPSGMLSRMFSWLPLRWLGNMSYSYYLLHGLALKAAFMVLPFLITPKSKFDWLIFFGMLPIMFLWTILPSAGLFLVVERPFSLVQGMRSATKPRSEHDGQDQNLGQ